LKEPPYKGWLFFSQFYSYLPGFINWKYPNATAMNR
jgi:hypothetical protein